MLEFCGMQWKESYGRIALMLIHTVWGCVLWFSISKYGLGVSTDSVQLLFGGYNFGEGRGLISYDGSFVSLWPPLYSILLGCLHRLLGADMLTVAGILQFITFLGLSACLSLFFARAFEHNFLLAVFASVLADIGVVVLTSFDTVGPDYLHLFFAMLTVLLTRHFIESGSPKAFLAIAAAAMLAALDRYLGIAALATAALTILLMGRGSRWQRLQRGAFIAFTEVPGGIWLAITSQTYTRRSPISFGENFSWFSKSVLEWFIKPAVLDGRLAWAIAGLWTGILVLIVLVTLPSRRTLPRQAVDSEPTALRAPGHMDPLFPMFVFGVLYLVTLFGSASIAYFNKLGGRFLLPLYIPFVTLLVAATRAVLRRTRLSSARGVHAAGVITSYGLLAATTVMIAQITAPLVMASHANGATGGENVYNTRAWRENPALQYWLGHVPTVPYALLSNEPDGVAFNAWQPAAAVPRKSSGPYGTEQYALSSYAADLFPAGKQVYVLWIEPDPSTYNYSIKDLGTIAEVETLFVSDRGGVYRLSPKPGT